VLLRQLLDGLAAQTFRDFEVIVVDDRSIDGSGLEVTIDARAGRPVRLVEGDGCGAVAARRAGVAQAVGEILAFTDSDCVPEATWLEVGVATLDQGNDVVQGMTLPARPPRPLERTVSVGHEDGLYATCNVLYRRDAFEAAGGFDAGAGDRLGFRRGPRPKGLGFGEDSLLGWRVRRRGRAAFAPGAIVRHHVFAPDPRASLSRAWMAGAFPALVREVPELRRSLLQWGVLLGPTRVPLYAGAVAAATRRRRAAAGLLGLWLIGHGWRIRRQRPTLAGLTSTALAEAGVDLVTAVALVAGSARARSVVL
jgi:hypothetical protein